MREQTQPPFSSPYDKCGPNCVARTPMLDTADGNEHQDCLDEYGSYDDVGNWIANHTDSDLPALGEAVNGRTVAYIGDPL